MTPTCREPRCCVEAADCAQQTHGGESDAPPLGLQAANPDAAGRPGRPHLLRWFAYVAAAQLRADQPMQPMVHGRGQVADAEPAVPGWRLAVNDIFP